MSVQCILYTAIAASAQNINRSSSQVHLSTLLCTFPDNWDIWGRILRRVDIRMYIHQIYLYLFIFKHNSFERCFLSNGVILVNECIVFNGQNLFCDVHCISYIYFLVCLIISLCMRFQFFDGITIASSTFVVSVKDV